VTEARGAGAKGVLKAFPYPGSISLPLASRQPKVGIRKGRLVSRGETLATTANPAQGIPDLVAPLPGNIARISSTHVTLEVDLDIGLQARALDFSTMSPTEARDSLLRLGIRPPRAPRPGEPVFISGFDPEPGVRLAGALLGDQRGVLEAGIRLVLALFPGKAIVQALPPGPPQLGFPGSQTVRRKISYPHTLPAFLKWRLEKDAPFDRLASGVVGLRQLWLLGRAWSTGLPPLARPLSIQGVPSLVPPGMSPLELLSLVNLTPRDGDRIVLGGLARGFCAWDPSLGLGQDQAAVCLVRGGGKSPPPRACRLCGRCQEACPLRLPVHVLGSAPMSGWHMVLAEHRDLATCPACGLCALACPSRLPLCALRGVPAPVPPVLTLVKGRDIPPVR
jgi:electron transport complex protein RnfC